MSIVAFIVENNAYKSESLIHLVPKLLHIRIIDKQNSFKDLAAITFWAAQNNIQMYSLSIIN